MAKSSALTAVLVLMSVVAGFVSAQAEVFHIPVGQQAPEKHDLPRPPCGMSQDAVLEQFGLPEGQTEAVGEPPLSNWRYSNYTVYVESETVIHSVLTHPPQVDVEQLESQ